MRSVALAALVALLSVAAPVRASTTLRVLFVGNSLTYYNDVPSMVAALVRAVDAGIVIESDMLADGGATMRDHLIDDALARALKSARYDIVVLQDRGGYPLCQQGDAACSDSVAAMCEASKRVTAVRAKAIWYGTWQTIPQAQEVLSDEGRRAASKCGIEFADVGAAMQRGRNLGLANLWLPDGHPTAEGSWVAASVLAHAIVAHPLPQNPAIDAVCRRRWENPALTRRSLASNQRASSEDCDAPDARALSIAIAVANSIGQPLR
ncbi:MAG TPA: hypothetical protein VFL30_02370 [Rhodanobacteraceae bacterium]|nr:hypothetical protein [Rhodanobacteraceae bacterium]